MASFGPDGASAIASSGAVTDALGYQPSSHTVRSFTVNGDANTYYPVAFFGAGAAHNTINIYKHVHDYATWDGIVEFECRWGDRGWGGYIGRLDVIRHRWSAKNFIAKWAIANPVGDTLILWMRGGGRSYSYRTEIPLQQPSVYTTGLPVNFGTSQYPDNRTSMTTVDSIANKQIYGGNASWLRVEDGGRVLTPANPAFFCHFTGGNEIETAGQIRIENGWSFDTNEGSHADATGRFTAPCDGRYFFSLCLMHQGNGIGDFQPRILKNGSNYANSNQTSDGSAWNTCTVTAVMYLSTNDYVDPSYYSNQSSSQIAVYSGGRFTHWSGYLIG